MKANRKATTALTLIEAMIVVVVLTLLILLCLLPALARSNVRTSRISCVNNLKQAGLGFRLWALDNNDQFPMQVSITSGGAMEWAQQGIAWPVFQVMSNELNTPKILVCPEDRSRTNALNFGSALKNSEISYFVGLNAVETQPQMLLAGDSDLMVKGGRLNSGIVDLGTNRPVQWSGNRHKSGGVIAMSDGSVQFVTTSGLQSLLQNSGNSTNRIVIP